MDGELIIVIGIVVVTAGMVVRHYYRRLTGKTNGCSCCPHSGGDVCHCKEKEDCQCAQ